MDYIDHNVILTSLNRNFKNKEFHEEDILNWCQEVETIYIADPDSMVKYMEIPLRVVKKRRVSLPSNMYKLLDVYEDKSDYDLRVSYRRLPGHLRLNRDIEEVVYINYIGTPLDSNCMPMIDRNHQAACETYCKINAFEEDISMNKINQNLYFDWKERFDRMIQGAKGGVDKWGRNDWAKMTIIMGDMLPRIGYMPLAHRDVGSADPPREPYPITLQPRQEWSS